MPRDIIDMTPTQIANLVATTKGARLRAMLDAAQDVAAQSVDRSLRLAAQVIIAASRQNHPEYWDPTLRGA